MVELRRPIHPQKLEPIQPPVKKERKTTLIEPLKQESVQPAVPEKPKPVLIEPRRKPKPAPKPPATAEEWIGRATADGLPHAGPKPLAVTLDAGSIDYLETMAIDSSLNKLALIRKLILDAGGQVEEIRAFGKTFADPPGPVQIRTFLLPAEVFAAANTLPRLLRVFGRAKAFRLLIAYYASRSELA